MKIEISDSFAATAAELSALFASAELTAARVQAIRTHSASFANYSFSQIKNTDGAITKTLFSTSLSASDVPARIQMLFPHGVQLVVETEFTPPIPAVCESGVHPQTFTDGRSTARIEFNIQLKGIPAAVSGFALIAETFSGNHIDRGEKGTSRQSKLTYYGELSVNIPFIGKMAEAKIREELPDLFKKDFALIRRLISADKTK